MRCVSDATKRYDAATHGLNNIMFLNTFFLALNVHFERTEVVFQIPFHLSSDADLGRSSLAAMAGESECIV